MTDTERTDRLKDMYRKYKKMGHPQAAQRTLDRLIELGVAETEITALKME